jgi:hypothetical protein
MANDLSVISYPRSGNFFVANALAAAFKTGSVYMHGGSTASIITAQSNNDFVVVPFRDPLDCIASYNVNSSSQPHSANPGIQFTLDDDINYYIRFFTYITKNNKNVVLLDFSKFQNDVSYIVSKIEKVTSLIATDNSISLLEISAATYDPGLKTLPSPVPNPNVATVKATIQADSRYSILTSLYATLQSMESAQ